MMALREAEVSASGPEGSGYPSRTSGNACLSVRECLPESQVAVISNALARVH
jgi:hypothetical protein